MAVTAKVLCTSKNHLGETDDSGASLSFGADYADDRNKAWAEATPSISLSMTVNAQAATHFAAGKAYTLTFEEQDD